MNATVNGIPLTSLSLEQLYHLRDLVNAEIARRQAPTPETPGPMMFGHAIHGDNTDDPPAS